MTSQPGYLHRLLAAVNSGAIPRGDLTSVEVEHALGCHHHERRGVPCTCHPRITVLAGDDVLVIGSGGAVLERRKRQ